MFDRQVSEKRDVRAGLDIDAFKSLMARQIGYLYPTIGDLREPYCYPS
jgi:hypothetical protein